MLAAPCHLGLRPAGLVVGVPRIAVKRRRGCGGRRGGGRAAQALVVAAPGLLRGGPAPMPVREPLVAVEWQGRRGGLRCRVPAGPVRISSPGRAQVGLLALGSLGCALAGFLRARLPGAHAEAKAPCGPGRTDAAPRTLKSRPQHLALPAAVCPCGARVVSDGAPLDLLARVIQLLGNGPQLLPALRPALLAAATTAPAARLVTALCVRTQQPSPGSSACSERTEDRS
mmetsp:Transcript_67647/g.152979  ORF Transcript_67647/g.152979 Transcript_67647/m.152979 type:complete len:228 (-) Transcript_67647:94-777(-)